MTNQAISSRLFEHRLQKAGVYLSALGVFTLAFKGIGRTEFRFLFGISLVDVCWALASPALLVTIWRNRRPLLKSPVFLSVLALAASQILASLLSENPTAEWRTIARQCLFVTVVGGMGSLARKEEDCALLRKSMLLAASIAISISLVGFAWIVLSGNLTGGVNPFVFMSANPIFDKWPRLTGTYGHSPEHFGEYLITVLAVLLSHVKPSNISSMTLRDKLSSLILLVALGLTFSFALVGGVVISAGVIGFLSTRSRPPRALLVVGTMVIVGAAAILMNLGSPTMRTLEEVERGIPCTEFDVHHTAFAIDTDDPRLCHPILQTRPRPSLTSMYFHAKQTALAIIEDHVLFGTGFEQYTEHARRRFHERFGTTQGLFYWSPHCFYLHAPATAGIPGGIALLVFLFAIWRARPSVREDTRSKDVAKLPIWLGIVAFLTIGINIDIVTNRNLWFLICLLVAAETRLITSHRAQLPTTIEKEDPSE